MSARRPAGGDARDAGLISLEWLLILAATIVMAGLTAVAANRVVDRSSDGISDAHADRVQAAIAAARQVVVDSQRDSELQPPYAARFGGWLIYYELRCAQVVTDFPDVTIEILSKFSPRDPNNFKAYVPVRPDRMEASDSPFADTPDGILYNQYGIHNGTANAIAHCAITGPPEVVAAYGSAS